MAADRVLSNRSDFQMEEDDDDDFESDEEWDDMDDDDDDDAIYQVTADCFFCPNTFPNIEAAVTHCCKDHGLDLSKLKARHKMDCYSYIKLVNFIRSERPNCSVIINCEKPLWSDDKYLMPVNSEDPWLSFDFDDIEEMAILPGSGEALRSGYPVNAEDGRVTLSETHFAELQRTIQNLNAQIKQKDEAIAQLTGDMGRMRVTLGEVVVGGTSGPALAQHVSDIRLEDDVEYFNTYAHFGIHHEMLSDSVRTASYRDALCLNSSVLEGSTVLDVGCGTAILSMLAARAGAARVIGVDQSDIIYHAMDIVRENNLSEKVGLVKGRVEEASLPVDKVDIIVSEWMGYFLLFEGMLDSVIHARDTYLRPGGLLLPNRCTLSMLGLSDPAMHAELVGFWSDVYGFKMSSLRGDVVREPQTRVVPPSHVATTAAQLCLLDLTTVTPECVDFTSDFALTATQDASLTALAGYFDTFFDLPHPVAFSTGPLSQPTHWKQTVFLLPDQIPVKQGEVLHGKLTCRRNRKELRSLIVTINIGEMKQKYLLS